MLTTAQSFAKLAVASGRMLSLPDRRTTRFSLLARFAVVAALFCTTAARAETSPAAMLVISRPPVCPPAMRTACADFEASLQHPAMHRLLENIEVVRETRADAAPFIAVRTPSGAEAMRWIGWLPADSLPTIVQRVGDVASDMRLAEAALHENDPDVLTRHWALTVLHFGDGARGRLLLESMLHSDSKENRELAEIWLERFSSRGSAASPCEEVFVHYAENGSTDLVRFEALMGIGTLRLRQGLDEQAARVFARARDLAPDGRSVAAAITAHEHATAFVPILGIGREGAAVAGRRSIRLRKLPRGTASVEYLLDGRRAAFSTTTPFVASVDFGRVPTRRVLDAVARDRNGTTLELTRFVVNERSEAFAVELTEPASAYFSGKVRVAASARVPRGRQVREVVIEWNGKRMARFLEPPYRTTIDVAPDEQGILRVVLRLDDGSEVEDARLANAAGSLGAEAHLIELPTYFDGAVPSASRVRLRENGVVRPVERVIPPSEAPLEVALLLDTSGSMRTHLLDLQEAAIRFVEETLEPGGRVMLVPFDSQAHVALRPTADREAIVRKILALETGGATALHDAVITALLQLQTAGTRRALVVFSDGLDANSVFDAKDVAEVARRAGVPIYVLAFVHPVPNVPQLPGVRVAPDPATQEINGARRQLIGLSKATGGIAFELRDLRELQKHWTAIAQDLARQSLVVYRAAETGPEWRPIELEAPGIRRIRAPAGAWIESTKP